MTNINELNTFNVRLLIDLNSDTWYTYKCNLWNI